jgi:CRP-like cAMP-binding protein
MQRPQAPDSRSLHERFGATFPAGRVVARQGETGGQLFVIVKGEVEVSVHLDERDQVVDRVGAGELLGVSSCFTSMPHSATMTAVEESFLLSFDRHTVEELIKAQPRFALAVIEALVERLRSATVRHVLPEREDGEEEGAQEASDRREAN